MPIFKSTLSEDPGLQPLLNQFIIGLLPRIEALREALSRESYDRVVILAHQLKGAAGLYGFADLRDMAAEIEDIATETSPQEKLSAALGRMETLARNDGHHTTR